MRNALPLLCPDGAAGVVARDEAVQPRPLCEQHHQGSGRGSLLDLGRGGGRGRLLALEAARASNSPACCHHTPTLLLFWLPPLEAATAESRSSVPLLLGERLARRALGERTGSTASSRSFSRCADRRRRLRAAGLKLGLYLGAQGAADADDKGEKPQTRCAWLVDGHGILAWRVGLLKEAVRRAPRRGRSKDLQYREAAHCRRLPPRDRQRL